MNRIWHPLQCFSGRRYAAALHLLEQNLVLIAWDGCLLYGFLQCRQMNVCGLPCSAALQGMEQKCVADARDGFALYGWLQWWQVKITASTLLFWTHC